MLSYKDNPNLPKKVVTLSNGEKEYRSNCKKIKNQYYVINQTCFEVKGKWYREESGLILKDFETGKWFLKEDVYDKVYGIVDFKNGTAVKGYFTANPYNNVYVTNVSGKTKPEAAHCLAINSDILAENNMIEDISTGTWMAKAGMTSYNITLASVIQNKLDYTGQGYNIEDNVEEALLKTKYYEDYDMQLSKDVRRYSRLLNDVSFGLEIECAKGCLPQHIQNRSGIVACRDGSLNDEDGRPGPEFTTIPLSGAKGLQNIVNISNELKKRTLLSTKCALHIHLGSLPTSRIFMVSLYVLGFKIQDELYKMFPYYKTEYSHAGKEKDYCKKLKKMNMGILQPNSSKEEYNNYINNNYTKLFYWLSQNQNGSGYNPDREFNRGTQVHPVSQKWNRINRYYWLNLMNILFSARDTVEFRLHTPTVNSQKIINWLFICNAIVRYAILNSRKILTSNKKISLAEVMNYYKDNFRTPSATFLSEYLKAYIAERTEKFQEDFNNNDYLSNWDILEDKTYEFKYKNVTHLF